MREADEPRSLTESLATEILHALTNFPEAGELVLGGYFAMRQYADYRTTNDVDAWWRTGKSERTIACLRQAMGAVAGRFALRSVELEPPTTSRWSPVLVESLADNVGSKLNALVQRGAPHDFMDIREVIVRGIVSVDQCWDWWSKKNPGIELDSARPQALRHLEGIEQRRPLKSIESPEERDTARRAREWIRRTLLDVPERPSE